MLKKPNRALHHHIFRACVPVVVTSTTNPYYIEKETSIS